MSSFSTAPATTVIYTLSLHDALPICEGDEDVADAGGVLHRHDAVPVHRRLERVDRVDLSHNDLRARGLGAQVVVTEVRSEEHTSELQSHHDLVCRLLLEKKK